MASDTRALALPWEAYLSSCPDGPLSPSCCLGRWKCLGLGGEARAGGSGGQRKGGGTVP